MMWGVFYVDEGFDDALIGMFIEQDDAEWFAASMACPERYYVKEL